MRLTRFILFASLCGARAFGQEADEASTADEQAAVSEEASALLAELTCRIDGATEADALPESILNWSNPDVGRVYGDVFLWIEQGRPVAAASIFRWFHPFHGLTIEFCSLSSEILAVDRTERLIWQAPAGGIEWKPLPNGQRPAGSRPLRLTQLKQMARRFSAELTDARAGGEGVNKILRLLPQPVYRYPESEALDGAVFAMVVGTDPELLLLVESDGDGWRYAAARMNRDSLVVRLDEQRVVSFPYIADELLFDTTGRYRCIVVENEE